jgi:hypothetical protein
MAYGAEKVVVNVRDGERGGLTETTPDGKEVQHYPQRFNVYWKCERLEVRRGIAWRESESTPPTLVTWVSGVAQLHWANSLGIIGDPKKTTTIVDISFRAVDDPLRTDLEHPAAKELSEPSSSFGRRRSGFATLGFTRADWETGTDESWWLQCDLYPDTLEGLIAGVVGGALQEVYVTVRLRDLYSDTPGYVPGFGRDSDLFLRPNKRDNTLEFPENAIGWVVDLTWKLQSAELIPAPQEEARQPETAAPPDESASPLMQATQLLAMRLEALRATVKWVGSLIVAMLLLFFLK